MLKEARNAGYTVCNFCSTMHPTIIVGNKNNNSYHLSNCKFAHKDKTKRVEFDSVEEAKLAKFKPCSTCNPDK